MKQITNTLLMIEPVAFRNNEETAVNNYYQKEVSSKSLQSKALKEFKSLVKELKNVGANLIVVKDKKELETPDSIFPNNWVSFHEGTVCVYPMFAKNRRNERRDDVLEEIEKKGFKIESILDYTAAEKENYFLEGTGSMVLDRENKIAYCALSPRSDEGLFIEFCEDLEYTPIIFRANQTVKGKRKPIYHTNVMLSIGEKFAVICPTSIDDKKQRKQVIDSLRESNKEVIIISEEQTANFAGNILQIKGSEDKSYTEMSKTAHTNLREAQIGLIEKHGQIIISDISTIEENGGGSVRCMLAEIF